MATPSRSLLSVTSSASILRLGGSVAHGDSVAGPHQHLVVVEPVPEGDDVVTIDRQEVDEVCETAALVDAGSRQFDAAW